jgi:hypothetical protein
MRRSILRSSTPSRVGLSKFLGTTRIGDDRSGIRVDLPMSLGLVGHAEPADAARVDPPGVDVVAERGPDR